MILYHISKVPRPLLKARSGQGKLVLKPTVCDYRLEGEPDTPSVCFSDRWWKCLMMLPRSPSLGKEELYLYRYNGPAEWMGKRDFYLSNYEWRVFEGVEVEYLGEIDIDNYSVSLALQGKVDIACPMCGYPQTWCDYGSLCQAGRMTRAPKYNDILIKFMDWNINNLVIFGSRSRGEEKDCSDWDFALPLRNISAPSKEEVENAIRKITRRKFSGAEFDIAFYDPHSLKYIKKGHVGYLEFQYHGDKGFVYPEIMAACHYTAVLYKDWKKGKRAKKLPEGWKR